MMVNLALCQRIERATVGLSVSDGHPTQSPVQIGTFDISCVDRMAQLGDFINRAKTGCSVQWITLHSTLTICEPLVLSGITKDGTSGNSQVILEPASIPATLLTGSMPIMCRRTGSYPALSQLYPRRY